MRARRRDIEQALAFRRFLERLQFQVSLVGEATLVFVGIGAVYAAAEYGFRRAVFCAGTFWNGEDGWGAPFASLPGRVRQDNQREFQPLAGVRCHQPNGIARLEGGFAFPRLARRQIGQILRELSQGDLAAVFRQLQQFLDIAAPPIPIGQAGQDS